MKFTDGIWQTRPGWRLQHPCGIQEYHIDGEGIHLLVLCKDMRAPTDLTDATTLEYHFTAPRQDMIGVRITHFAGAAVKGPAFQLNTLPGCASVRETDDLLILQSGRARVEVEKQGHLAFRFYYDDRLLTSADGLAAYATDAEYEADRIADYNHRRLSRSYTRETWLREALMLDVGEQIYGLGEHFTPLTRNGQNLDVWNRDGGSNTEQGYKCLPFHLSSRGYGVLVNTPDYVDYEFGTESVRHVIFQVEAETLEYIVIGGEGPKEVLGAYTALIGRSPVPPAWSFGLWLSTSWLPEFSREEILAAIDRMAALGIPLEVFHFDARWMLDYHDCDFRWHPRYGDAKQMLDDIHARGVRVCCWINPYVAQPSALFKEGLAGGYFLKKPDGSVWQTDIWMTGMAIVDFTNPAAAKWYCDRLGAVLDMGVDCIKTDFGERIPTDVVWHDGSDPRRMHNYYTFLYNKAIFELLQSRYGERGAVVFGRSATVGTQQFPVNWGGDNQASYISMAESLRGGLSFCQSGYGFWAHDISGFVGTATPDLYKRWAAFGMLSTHSRLHGQDSFRMPWCFDEESCRVLAHFARLKCSLMPYLYEAATNVHLTGQPMMRAMMLDFPDNPVCLHLDRQYMLGERLLVAPIFNDRGEAQFYLPAGRWTDYQSGEVFEGGRTVTRTYDYFGLPLCVRENSIICRGSTDSRTVYDYADGVTFQLFEPTGAAECRVYEEGSGERLRAVSHRYGDRLAFEVTGPAAHLPWSLLLINRHGVSAQNAEVRDTPRGALLTPAAGCTRIEVQL